MESEEKYCRSPRACRTEECHGAQVGVFILQRLLSRVGPRLTVVREHRQVEVQLRFSWLGRSRVSGDSTTKFAFRL
jgi:hypothetical protein